MDPRHLNIDKRLTGICVYCGNRADTRDHVPSRVLLDEPMPANVPVVDSCESCNEGFSLDEEYVACFLECVLRGSTDPEQLKREKVRRILTDKPPLRARIESNRRGCEDGTTVWIPEEARVRNVVLKLGRGHAAFELTLPQLEEPSNVNAIPLSLMSKPQLDIFERAGTGEMRGWPEIGSRGFLRACGAPPYEKQAGPWVVVQDGTYRYSVDQHGGVLVRMVLWEYLAAEVGWE